MSDEPQIVHMPVLLPLNEVEPEPVRWLWPGRIPRGTTTVIYGDPGLGKSLLTIDLAAKVSAGRPWPDSRHEGNSAGNVILLSAEDDLGTTIRPRLDAAAANVERIQALQAVQQIVGDGEPRDRLFDLGTDIGILRTALHEVGGVRLVIIDPVSAYLGHADSHRNSVSAHENHS